MATADLGRLPEFDHQFRLPSGVSIPALHPREVQGDDETDAVSDVEGLRRQCRMLVDLRFGRLLDELGGAELVAMRSAYIGWQNEWHQAIAQRAMEEAKAQRGTGQAASGQVASGAGPSARSPIPIIPKRAAGEAQAAAAGSQHGDAIRFPLEPGRPLPAFLGGHEWGSARPPDAGPVELKM
jgi:hypothetical protein